MELMIQAKPRTALGKQNKKLRAQGRLPAVLYGKDKENLLLEVSRKDFEKIFRQSGESTLVKLVIAGGGERRVLIHDVAKHFMKNEPIHVDFYEVDLTRKIHAKIPLHVMGISPVIKELGGILVKNLNEVEVEALPINLPHGIEVNVEGLKTFDDRIHLADLKVGDKVKILGHPEEVVISVQAPRTEAELAELEKPTAEAEKAAIEGLAAEEAKAKEEGAGEEAAKAGEAGMATEGKPPESKAEEPKKKEEKK